jgi:RHS repeat-associated protein
LAVGRTGTLAFRIAYDAYGEARHLPAKDINGDGKVDKTDTTLAQGAVGKTLGQPGYNPDADWDRDGTVTTRDVAQYGSTAYVTALPQGQLAQPGSPTQPAAGDLSPSANLARAANARSDFNIGFSGYRFNGDIGAYTVRFRHYDPTPGMCRWLERDPAGYQDGPSLYSYLGRNPMAGTDPWGLWLERPDELDRSDPYIRPPGVGDMLPPGHSVRLFAIYPDMPGYNEVLLQAEALSAIATTNLERGVDDGLGFIDRLLLSDSPLHMTLQAIGLVPVIGEPADILDGIVYALEGDAANASVSFAAMIPVAGQAATAARWGKRAANAAGAAADSVWALNKWDRGRAIEKALGHNLGNCQTIDKLVGRTVTSIKSIDLNAKTYQNMSKVGSKLREYVDDLADFKGTTYKDVEAFPGRNFDSRVLELAIPSRGVTAAQRQALEQAVRYGASRGVDVRIIPVH